MHQDALSNELFELTQYKERLYVALKAAKICVFEVDLKRQLYTFFENAEDIFGVSGERILEDVRPYSQLEPGEYQKAVSKYFSHPEDGPVIDRAFKNIFGGTPTTYQARMKAGGSDYIWCELHVVPLLEDQVPVKMIGVIIDINDAKKKTDKLVRKTHTDGFTGLYNKQASIDIIRQTLKEQPDQMHALVLLDIDDLKKINDTYGHAEGDRVIRTVADALTDSLRRTDVIGRFGGDEFILLIQNITNTAWLEERFQHLIQCGGESGCTNCIGSALYPQDAETFEELFDKADQALYRSKASKGKGSYTFFQKEGLG